MDKCDVRLIAIADQVAAYYQSIQYENYLEGKTFEETWDQIVVDFKNQYGEESLEATVAQFYKENPE